MKVETLFCFLGFGDAFNLWSLESFREKYAYKCNDDYENEENNL